MLQCSRTTGCARITFPISTDSDVRSKSFESVLYLEPRPRGRRIYAFTKAASYLTYAGGVRLCFTTPDTTNGTAIYADMDPSNLPNSDRQSGLAVPDTSCLDTSLCLSLRIELEICILTSSLRSASSSGASSSVEWKPRRTGKR